MSAFSNYFKLYHLAFLSGVLVGTSFIPFFPWALLFCYIPVWYFVCFQSQNLRQVWIAGWLTQFVLTLIGFHWISFVAHEYGYLPWPVAFFVLFVFASLMHLYIPLSFVAVSWLGKKLNLEKSTQILLFAPALTLGEIFWPSIFQWNLGYPLLWAASPISQWADVVGFQGLSFLVYLINSVFLLVFQQATTKKTIGLTASVALVLIGLHMTGIEREKNWDLSNPNSKFKSATEVRTLKILTVQANIGNFEKYQAEKGKGFQKDILQEFMVQTQSALTSFPDSDLVLWPESAVTDYLDDFAANREVPALFRQFVQIIRKPVITGAYSKDPPEQTTPRKDYNGAFLFSELGLPLEPPYRKTQLLIFGEYIPFVEQFPILAKYNPGGSGFGRGPGPTVFQFQDLKLGMQICYESLDPGFSAGLTGKGADMIVNMTNDSWFGPRSEPYQNLWMTLARAIENRRPLVRSTNTGISTAILANGQVLEQSPLFQKWAGQFEIPVLKNAPATIYSRIHHLIPLFIFGYLILLIILGKLYARHQTS